MLIRISTSGNTSGAYAFLRWCAALVLVVGALAGSAAATQEEVLVYIGVIPSSGQWNMIVEWDIPDDWTDKTSSGNHPIFYVDMVGEGIQCANPNDLEPGKNGPSFRRISASGDTEATLNVIDGRKYDNATLDQNNTYELNCNLHNPNGPHHRAIGFIEGKSVTVMVQQFPLARSSFLPRPVRRP